MLGGHEESLVLFKFHTAVVRRWMRNEALQKSGNVFDHMKRPVIDSVAFLLQKKTKFPVSKGRDSEVQFQSWGTDGEHGRDSGDE
jgi:hypothetical protein